MPVTNDRVFTARTDDNEIARLIAFVDDTIVADRLQKMQLDAQFASIIDAIAALENNNEFLIICNKSGNEIGKISDTKFATLQKLHGTEKALNLIRRKQLHHIDDAWICTDDNALHNLSIHDPIGYFVYAAGFVLGYKHKRDTIETKLDWLYQKHELNYILHNAEYNMEQYIRANEMMRRYLALIDNSSARKLVKFTAERLPEIAHNVEQWINELALNITTILKHEIRNNRIKPKLSYDDIVALKNIYKGHSNFRAQLALRKRSQIDTIADELQNFIPRERYGYAEEIFSALPRAVLERESREFDKPRNKSYTVNQPINLFVKKGT